MAFYFQKGRIHLLGRASGTCDHQRLGGGCCCEPAAVLVVYDFDSDLDDIALCREHYDRSRPEESLSVDEMRREVGVEVLP